MSNQSDSVAALAAAFSKFQGELESAIKDANNPHFRSKYADLASIREAIKEPLAKNGLSVTQLPMPGEKGTLRLRSVLLHSSGEWIASEMEMPLAKVDPQGYGSALTYARRYSLAALLGVVQDDDDAEGAMGRNTPAKATEPPEKPKAAPKSEGVDLTPVAEATAKTGIPKSDVVDLCKALFDGKKPNELTQAQVDQLAAEVLKTKIA